MPAWNPDNERQELENFKIRAEASRVLSPAFHQIFKKLIKLSERKLALFNILEEQGTIALEEFQKARERRHIAAEAGN